MHLLLTTSLPVSADPQTVLARFDEALFRALAPPFPRMRVDRFDGSRPGDIVAVTVLAGGLRQQWVSRITDAGHTSTEAWFVDEGQTLPWPFRTWRHRHLVRLTPGGDTEVVDDLTYSTAHPVLDWLTRPFLWGLLAYRKPIYRRLLTG